MNEITCEVCGKHPACTWKGVMNLCLECAMAERNVTASNGELIAVFRANGECDVFTADECPDCGGSGELAHDCGEDTCCCVDAAGEPCPTCGGI